MLASSLRLRLPLGTSASNLSISYSVDFAALLLIGREMTMLVAGASACAQSIFGTNRRNPAFRILFNAAALVLTVQAAGVTFTYFGGQPGDLDLASIAKPLVASALAYYLVNTLIVATAVGLAARQPVWQCLADELPVDRAELLRRRRCRGGGRRAVGRRASGGCCRWPAAPVYLTFRSYRMYVDRIASEKRHKEEVLRLHGDTVAALEAARRSEQRYALAAAGSNDGLWDWDIPANSLYCSDRWKLIVGLDGERRGLDARAVAGLRARRRSSGVSSKRFAPTSMASVRTSSTSTACARCTASSAGCCAAASPSATTPAGRFAWPAR